MSVIVNPSTGRVFGETAYRGADQDYHRNWNPRKRSADADLLPDKSLLDARTSDLIRNNGVAKGAKQTTLDNVVGSFFLVSPKPNYHVLGKDIEWARAWSKNAKNRFKVWANSLDSSLARNQNFHQMTQLTFKQAFDVGESLAIPRWKPNAGRQNAFCIQIMDPDRLSNPNHEPNARFRRRGIDINQDAEAIGYWISSRHKDDVGLSEKLTWKRIPARTRWGRRKVIHSFDLERPEQSRGIGALVSALSEFKILDKYTQSELKATANNALIAAFVESDLPDELMREIFQPGADGEAGSTAGDEYRGARNAMDYNLKDGAMIPLVPGDKINAFAPGRPNPAYSLFVENIFRQIGVSLNLPYELLLKDFSKTNYSSARASLLEAYRFFKNRRAWLVAAWAQPIYELWIEEEVNKGAIEAPDFYANKAAYCQSTWIASGKGWVDPVKEIKGAQLRMQCKMSNLELENAEQGHDWEEVLEQAAYEKQKLDELGLSMSDIYPDDEPELPEAIPNQTGGLNENR